MKYLLFVLVFLVAVLTACGGRSVREEGGLRISLRWDNTADLDLVVRGPSGYRGTTDDTNGFGPEVIYWSSPPTANYRVLIDYDHGPLPVNYLIRISGDAGTKTYRGTISYRFGIIYVATVTHEGREVYSNSNRANHITGRGARAEYIASKSEEEGCIVDCDEGKELNDIHNISALKINTTMSDGAVVIYGILINGSLINGTIESLD